MKKLNSPTLLFLIFCISCINLNATSYTFTASGSWFDQSLWTPSFPGSEVSVGHEVIIPADVVCEIPTGTAVMNNGTLTNNGTMLIYNSTSNSTSGTWINNGVMDIQIGTYYNLGIMTNNGSISHEGTFAIISNDPFTNSETGTINSNGIFYDPNENAQLGIFKGNGNPVFDFTNSGVLAPGQSPGILTFGGAFTQIASGTYEVELAGTGGAGAENGHDKIEITGNAVMDGTLKVVLIDGFTPSVGTIFSIASYGSHSGTFSTLDLPGGAANWLVSYNPTELTIELIGALPVELIVFDGKLLGQKIELNWQTASELNNSGFEIQRCMDVQSWEKIGWLDGAMTINSIQSYQFTDQSPEAGVNYYRLKQIDLDGQFEFSNIISIDFIKVGKVTIAPNPSTDQTQISFESLSSAQEVTIRIFNGIGKSIYTEKTKTSSGGLQTVIIPTQQLASGVYFVELRIGNHVDIHHLLVK